ncbi:MAG: DUF2849 domain-containing protein [Proteobacteria bacterium]|nr:DUF2849 domain-containing protein [Pseudomonadota bacterium]MCH8188222.1 DUF2849 domain-containing protein [Pseudomonadota bacterium]
MTRIVTANRLRDGLVVFLSADGAWSERIGDAAAAADEAGAQELMAMAERSAAECRVVEPYLVEVEIAADGLTPGHRPVRHRESIRVSGPTVQTSLNGRIHGGHA